MRRTTLTSLQQNVLEAIKDHVRMTRKTSGVDGIRMSVADETYYASAISALIKKGYLTPYRPNDDATNWWYKVTSG